MKRLYNTPKRAPTFMVAPVFFCIFAADDDSGIFNPAIFLLY